MKAYQYKKIGIIMVFVALLCGLFGYYYMSEKGPIYEFNPKRDTTAILNLFDKNWYWLIANEGSSPVFYLKYRTPNENPAYFGKLQIKVMRENNELIGFVAYYKEKPENEEWRLLFLAVDEKFRGKGYGSTLAEYAMKDMSKQGAKKIGLWTRLSNPAQRIYRRLGFVEAYYTEGGYIYFEYYVK